MCIFELLLFYCALIGCPFEIIGKATSLKVAGVDFCEDSEYAPGSCRKRRFWDMKERLEGKTLA